MVQNKETSEMEDVKIYCHIMEQSELKKFDKNEKLVALSLYSSNKGKLHHTLDWPTNMKGP